MRRRLPAIRRFRRRRRAFVILEDTGDLAEQALLFLGILLIRRILAIRRLRRSLARTGRWQYFLASSKHPREESPDSLPLIAGLSRFGAGHEGGGIVVRTSRCSQPVGNFVEFYINHSARLSKRSHVGILRESSRFLHELRPDRRGGLSA